MTGKSSEDLGPRMCVGGVCAREGWGEGEGWGGAGTGGGITRGWGSEGVGGRTKGGGGGLHLTEVGRGGVGWGWRGWGEVFSLHDFMT